MPSPFPGMDPYLEAPAYWPDFHNRLAANICEQLNPSLPDGYFASCEMTEVFEILIEDGADERRLRPDLTVEYSEPTTAAGEGGGLAVAAPSGLRTALTEPSLMFAPDPIELASVEIRQSRGHRVVTQIEILSPANKSLGRDHDAYQAKRDTFRESDISLVEIDLLRDGYNPNGHAATVAAPYFAASIPAPSLREPQKFYYIRLSDVLPVLPVPLREDEPPHPLDLQHAFTRTYDGGGYLKGKVDYAAEATPPLEGDEAEFARRVLTAAGLRPKAGDA